MPFTLERIVPWGRTLAEYQGMFSLTEADRQGRILGCGDGPASFNAEMTALGYEVVSVDPLYAYSAADIQEQGEAVFDLMIDQTREFRDGFVWTYVPSVEDLGQRRMGALRGFVADYPQGKAEGRYVEAALPDLDFPDQAFDLALCSHLLFVYSKELDLEFHIAAIQEMLRLAPEARIFPLTAVGGWMSPYLEDVIDFFRAQGCQADRVKVDYEFVKGGNEMLRVRR